MSAGIPGHNASMRPSVALALRMGILPVIAVGNEGPNTTRSPGNYTEALSARGLDPRQQDLEFVRRWYNGTGRAELHGPRSCRAGQRRDGSCVMGGGYEAWNGTSMATPIVSGVAALILQRYPNISLADLIEEIAASLVLLPSVPAIRQGAGLLQFPRNIWHLGV